MMRSAKLVAVVAALTACGRLGFDERAASGDAAGEAAAPCTAFGPWSPPTRLANVSSTATDYGAEITRDGLGLYFDSERTGSGDLYVARRASRAEDFGPPALIAELDTAAVESDATVTADELDLFFHRGLPGDCLFEARRASPSDPWGTPVRLDALCVGTTLSGPFLSRDGLALYANTSVDMIGEGHLQVGHRASRADPFTSVTEIAELSPGPNKGFAALTDDQLTIYFEEVSGVSGLRLRQASRATSDAAFGAEEAVPGVALGPQDGDPSITADGLELVFASNATGDHDLYHSTRSCQ